MPDIGPVASPTTAQQQAAIKLQHQHPNWFPNEPTALQFLLGLGTVAAPEALGLPGTGAAVTDTAGTAAATDAAAVAGGGGTAADAAATGGGAGALTKLAAAGGLATALGGSGWSALLIRAFEALAALALLALGLQALTGVDATGGARKAATAAAVAA